MVEHITPAVVPKPLTEFETIGHNTLLWTSPSFSEKSPLILLFSWNAAATKHIAKYTVSYRKLFPSSRIILLRCCTRDFFRYESTYARYLIPALVVVKEHVERGGEILLHSFSNGGANQLVEFAKAWRKQTGQPLPIRAQMLDSSPGKGDWNKSHQAMVFSLPRTLFFRIFGSTLIHLLLVTIFIVETGTRSEHKNTRLCKGLNDPALLDVKAPRVYLYSMADKMISYDDVEEHADEAAAKGWRLEKVKFENSPHVNHVKEDEKKYWNAVMAAWDRGGQQRA